MPREGIDEARSGLMGSEEEHNGVFKKFCHAAKFFFSKNTGLRAVLDKIHALDVIPPILAHPPVETPSDGTDPFTTTNQYPTSGPVKTRHPAWKRLG
ncbi:uncharacterized protein ARMOST_01904 [Armillaria ostoyae]|uniref:Uncharacterized protein n=1 Tax=Armillaria ostoyae TaxID=47428 RepID=A0A284QQ84_ARMOS|nr:uncharacterized protein ARMOST_01904 [Armillaria ostoyae]